MKSVPFFAVAGTIFEHDELGRLRFIEHLGDWVLHLVLDDYPDAGPIRVRLRGSTERVMPTVPWLLAEFAEGRLRDIGNSSEDDVRAGKLMGLDRAACMARDPKSAYRHDWALAAIQAGMPKSADVLKIWIATAPIPRHPDDTPKVSQLKNTRPHERSVIRWMNRLQNGNMLIGSMVNASGRLEGDSQLSNVLDRLVHRVAMTYISDPRLASISDAAALCDRLWRQLEAAGVPDIGIEPPTMETVRLRLRSLDGRIAEEMRNGKHGATKRFDASGEPVEVEHCLERVYMDGTEFEHACLYSDDWPIASSKMKGVYSMCARSEYAFRGAVFTGPYRGEMGVQAALNIMVAQPVTAEEVAANPYAGLLVGLPSDLMYDNDKANIPPGVVPNAVTAISTVELAPVYLHDAKAKLERYFKYIKGKVRKVKGQIRGPSRMADPRYDPIKDAEVTRAQYAMMLEDARNEWNRMPRKAFGGKSPEDLMIEHLNASGIRLVDPGKIRRHFARTPSERQVLTNDGLVYDHVRYRWNRDGIEQTLENNHRRTKFKQRLEGTAKALVTIRVYDGDIDMIEMLDEETGDYHKMWSTNPGYTGGLSRWEHNQYCEMVRAGKGGATSDKEWLAIKGQKLVAFDQEMPKADFSAREKMTALIESEEFRRKSGLRGSDPLFGQLPELGLPTDLGGENRADLPAPPPQKQARKPKSVPKAPKRPADYGYASTAHGGAATGNQRDSTAVEQQTTRPRPRSKWDVDDLD